MNATTSSLSVHLGEGARIDCYTYPHRPDSGPILAIDFQGGSLSLSSRSLGAVDAGDVETAHRLAEAVAVYVAETERLHARNTEHAASSTSAA
ncbi:hypothetical protein [Spirillospora sp. NBC_01491]|uniref:hypothetical protein n=1 Tax=Spirillospora sp. NBC_01491 TaxID=2976007 RepID=UPI002E329C48|nr:hypothetical protein [Spirillospora sp. NBC_01491]